MATVTGLTAEETIARLSEKVDLTALNELIDDRVAVLLRDGTDTPFSYDDTAGKLVIPAGGGGGMSSVFGARRMQCTTFSSFYSSGTAKTVVSCTGWTDMGAILTDATYDPQAPVLLVAGDGSAFDTQDAGIYSVRFMTNITFTDDAGTPGWVTDQASGYFQNRPAGGIHKTILNAEQGARYYGSGPGVYFETFLDAHQRIDWDPDDGSYYLSLNMQWPGNIAASTATINVTADVTRIG